MFTINKKNNNKFCLKAISIKDELAKEKKPYCVFNKKDMMYFVLPSKNEFTLSDLIWNLRSCFASLKSDVNVDLCSFVKLIDKKYHKGFFVQAILTNELVNYVPFCLKTSKKEEKINFLMCDDCYKLYEKEIKAAASAFNLARKLELMPSNYLNPKKFVDIVVKAFEPFKENVQIKVLNNEQLIKKGMNLIASVGAGSSKEDKPMLLSISFKNKATDFALVGKGITFDTGGINLKPTPYLKGMQYDMTGASIAVAVMYMLAALKIKANFSAIVPLSNNDISSSCIKVGDVMTSYSGKTVEMTNTDAEGRLILADAVTYAIKDLKAKNVATIATLTGGVVVALADIFSAFWSTDENMKKQLEQQAELCGEYVWNFPFHDAIKNKVINKSAIADYINSDESRQGQSIAGAEFIRLFANDINFMHFDIAGTNETKVRGISQPLPILMYTLFNFIKENYNGKKQK